MLLSVPAIGMFIGLIVKFLNDTPKVTKVVEPPQKTRAQELLEHCVAENDLYAQGDPRGIYGLPPTS